MDWLPVIGTVLFSAFAALVIEILKKWGIINSESAAKSANLVLGVVWAALVGVMYYWPETTSFIVAVVQFIFLILGAVLGTTGVYKLAVQKKDWWD